MSMSFIASGENNGLLDYAIRTDPDPLQVSPVQGNPSIAALTIVVSNGTSNPIYCTKITFSFDIGALAQDLTNVYSGILVAASPAGQWQIASTGAGTFEAIPSKPEYNRITATGLSFRISNIQVNQQVGTFAFKVDEYSSLNNPGNFSNHKNIYKIAKFPSDFFVSNFTAKKPQVNNGETATLTWFGSDGASYTMLYDSHPPVDVSNVRSWTTPPLDHETNFILKASAQSQGETVNTYLSTVVTVANPDMTMTSLKVLQASALQGDTTVGTAAANAHLAINGTLTASGAATLGSLSSTGNANIDTLNVSGNSNLTSVTTGGISTGNAHVNGTLNVSQMSSLADTLIQGTLSSSGVVGMLGSGQSVTCGSYRAKTDGFVIGSISGGGSDARSRSVGWIYCVSGAYRVQATGGNNVYWLDIRTWSPSHWGVSSMPNSFILPVKKGNIWSANLQLPKGNDNDVNPVSSFYWIPVGAGNVADTFEKIADLEPEHIVVPGTAMNEGYRDGSAITEFVDVLEDVLQNPEQDHRRERLIEAVSKLFNAPR